MSLHKAIAHRKEKRKPFYGSKVFDRSCQNHGGCPWCLANRTYQQRRLNEAAEQERRELS